MKLRYLLLALLFILISCSTENLSRSLAGKYDNYEVTEQFQLPQATKRLIDFEQGLIDRNVDTDKIYSPDIANQDLLFRPENQKWFSVKTYWIPEEELNAVNHSSAQINSVMTKSLNGQTFYCLIVHPESESFYQELTSKYSRGEDMYATSTSSSRTVLIRTKDDKIFFGKLSLNVKLGGVVRTIPRGEVSRSVGTTMILDEILKKEDPNASPFHYIRESFGIIPKDFERGGMIIREIPTMEESHSLLPLFSIYAKNANQDSILKKWIQLAEKENKIPREWIKEKILAPFAKGWSHAYLDQHFVMEAHAQNVLIEVDKNNFPVGKFFHRDFGGFNVNLEYYKDESWYSKLPYFTDIQTDYHQKSSEKAVVQSLDTYFESGFLFNLNKEYAEITGDAATDFRLEFRKILALEIENRQGIKLNPTQGASFYQNIAGLSVRKTNNSKSLCKKLMEFFF
jgi:hypothetical protein